MRFNSDAYNELFPREAEKPIIESAVETFKPTEQIEDSIAEGTEVNENGLDNDSESICE